MKKDKGQRIKRKEKVKEKKEKSTESMGTRINIVQRSVNRKGKEKKQNAKKKEIVK